MKTQALLGLLFLIGLACAFSISNPTPFPPILTAGASYSSNFLITASGPFNVSFQAEIDNATASDMNVSFGGNPCIYLNNSVWDCSNISENSSGIYGEILLVSLPLNLAPAQYSSTLFYSGVEDQPSPIPGFAPTPSYFSGGGEYYATMPPPYFTGQNQKNKTNSTENVSNKTFENSSVPSNPPSPPTASDGQNSPPRAVDMPSTPSSNLIYQPPLRPLDVPLNPNLDLGTILSNLAILLVFGTLVLCAYWIYLKFFQPKKSGKTKV